MSQPDRQTLFNILNDAKTIAVVGASGNPSRPSFGVMQMLQREGYRVIPVNPNETEILGEKTYATLSDVPDRVDIVDVFRRAEATPDIAREAVKIGAGTLWLQLGIVNPEAEDIARAGGLQVVMDQCTAIVHRQLDIPRKGAA